VGGVPKEEIVAQRPLFEAVGLSPSAVFHPRPRPSDYADFRADLAERSQIKDRVEEDPGAAAQRAELEMAFAAWWEGAAPRLVALAGNPQADLLGARNALRDAFEVALLPVGVLDRFQVTGAVAAWWDAIDYDLRTLANQGFQGLVDSWVASIRAAVEDDESRNGQEPLDHPLVERLLPGYLDRLDALAARDAELKAQIAEGKRLQEDDEADEEDVPTDDELTEMRRERRAARKERRELQADFLERLDEARAGVGDDQARDLVLEIERERLAEELERYATAKGQALVAALETLWDKYHVSLRELEAERDAAAARLEGFVEELGYD
jgi:type I restriction enzyme M protein